MIVQVGGAYTGSTGNVISATLSSPTTARSTLLVYSAGVRGVLANTVSDSIGTQYTRHPVGAAGFFAGTSPAAATNTVTARFNTIVFPMVAVLEFFHPVYFANSLSSIKWSRNESGGFDAIRITMPTTDTECGIVFAVYAQEWDAVAIRDDVFRIMEVSSGQQSTALYKAVRIPTGSSPSQWSAVGIFHLTWSSWAFGDAVLVPLGVASAAGPTVTMICYDLSVVADFTYLPVGAPPGTPYTFTEACLGYPSEFLWEFPFGETFTTSSVVYTFGQPGVHNVRLTARRGSKQSSITKQVVVPGGGGYYGGPTEANIPTVVTMPFLGPLPGSVEFSVFSSFVGQQLGLDDEVIRPRRPPLLATPLPDVDDKARLEQMVRVLTTQVNSLSRQNILRQIEDGEFTLRGRGFAESRAPTRTDDETKGAGFGSVWVFRNVEEGKRSVYLCVDPSERRARWMLLFSGPLT